MLIGGEWERVRFHDYGRIYSIPGLYEKLFYEVLECQSPTVIRELLAEELEGSDLDPEELCVFDLGAGNGMVGEQLAELGAGSIVGADIVPEAAEAQERDRPGLYEDYVIGDLTDLPAEDRARLDEHEFNCMASVAALGFGDIPPQVFAAGYSLVERGGLIAFCIKEEMIAADNGSGFYELIEGAIDGGAMELRRSRTYRHRLSIEREPIHYRAMIARKRNELASSG